MTMVQVPHAVLGLGLAISLTPQAFAAPVWKVIAVTKQSSTAGIGSVSKCLALTSTAASSWIACDMAIKSGQERQIAHLQISFPAEKYATQLTNELGISTPRFGGCNWKQPARLDSAFCTPDALTFRFPLVHGTVPKEQIQVDFKLLKKLAAGIKPIESGSFVLQMN